MQDTTIEKLLCQPDVDPLEAKIFRRAAVDGLFQYKAGNTEEKRIIARWLIRHKQGELLSRWLELTPLTVTVSTREIATGLLAIMQSPLSFSNLTLQVCVYNKTDTGKEIIPLIGQAFQANQSLTNINLYMNASGIDALPCLFDMSAGVGGLCPGTVHTTASTCNGAQKSAANYAGPRGR